jgi:PAS domain S-box-containing protein
MSQDNTPNIGDVLKGVVDQMLEGFQLIDRNWRYLYVNETVARQGRRTKGELIGRTMMECYPGIETTPSFALYKKAMDEGISSTIEHEFTFPDESTGWFQLFVHPSDEGILILSVDITDRKRAEEELKNKIHEVSVLLSSTTDRELRIVELRNEVDHLKVLADK